MVSKPILFNTEMVKAILDGRKTQTRRLVKAKGWNVNDIPKWAEKDSPPYWFAVSNDHQATVFSINPPYDRGDILWVRETFDELPVNPDGSSSGGKTCLYYKADGDLRPEIWQGIWYPSIHMPRKAARLFLRVTDIRAERLQNITDADALKEGVPSDDDFPMNEVYCPVCHGEGLHGALHPVSLGYMEVDCENCDTPVKRFSHLWNSTIKYDDVPRFGWEANPLVWVIEFERVKGEIEE